MAMAAETRSCPLGPQCEAVGADAVAVAIEVVDAFVFRAGLAEDGVGRVGLPEGKQAGEVRLAVDRLVLEAVRSVRERAAKPDAWHTAVGMEELHEVGAAAAVLAEGTPCSSQRSVASGIVGKPLERRR